MSDELDPEALKDFVSLLRGLREDRVIAQSELALLDTPDHMPVPMPNEAHPALAHGADFVRQWRQDGAIRLAVRRGPLYTMPEDTAPTSAVGLDSIMLTRQKVQAPAPFVGDPRWERAAYVWGAWSDGTGRYITTDAELIWRGRA